jgi:hypothetical protein
MRPGTRSSSSCVRVTKLRRLQDVAPTRPPNIQVPHNGILTTTVVTDHLAAHAGIMNHRNSPFEICTVARSRTTAQRRSTDRRGLTGGTSQCIYGTNQLILCASSPLPCPFGSCLQRRRASSFTISSILPVYSPPKLSSTPNACLTHCAIPIRVSCPIPHKCDDVSPRLLS